MQAKELVTILEENNPDYSRQALLDEINFVQRIIFGSANMLTLVTDDTTGDDPKITPASAEHVISDAMRIDRVYKKYYNIPMDVRIQGDTIYFDETHVGQEYYVRYYKKLTELTSEQMELMVPDEHVDVLEQGVELRIASKEHGSYDDWDFWKSRKMPKLKRKLNNNYKWSNPNESKKSSACYRAVRRTGYC